jgi:hypothetical protein
MLKEIFALMVTKQGFIGHRSTSRMMRPRVSIAKPTSYNGVDSTMHSTVMMRHIGYCLPIGEIRVTYGCKSKESGQLSIENEYTLTGVWEFHPAAWLSQRTLTIRAMLLIRCGIELKRPTITPTLSTTVVLSHDHPVWDCLRRGDVTEFRQLLSLGLIGLNDIGSGGDTLLDAVYQLPARPLFAELTCRV